jgi:hypothetical protein
MAREVEYFFIYVLDICTSSFENSPILHWGVDSLGVEIFELPIDSGYWSLIG